MVIRYAATWRYKAAVVYLYTLITINVQIPETRIGKSNTADGYIFAILNECQARAFHAKVGCVFRVGTAAAVKQFPERLAAAIQCTFAGNV